MCRIAIACMLCLLALPFSAHAVSSRPTVGFLPFQGATGTCGYAISESINWQISYIPGIGSADLEPVMRCIALDRLKVPKSLADSAAYCRLAAATGNDYLVTGEVERQDKSLVRFRVVVYSATDPRFHKEHIHECGLSELPKEAISAAKEIAAAVGVPVSSAIRFDRRKIDPEALRAFDESLRLFADFERDVSDYWHKSDRLALKAKTLCPANPMLCKWALSYSNFDSNSLGEYRKLYARCPGNIPMLLDIIDQCCYLEMKPEAKRYANELLKLDPTSRSAQIVARGTMTLPSQGGWRTELGVAYSYQMISDIRRLRPLLESLEKRCPKSAYVRYCAGLTLSQVGEGASAVAEYESALRINPSSYRLRMMLVSAYINVYRKGDALDTLKPALKRWPNRSEPHLFAAWLYREWKLHDKAASEMKKAEKLDPDADIDHKLIAGEYMRSGNVVESVQELAAGNPAFRQATIVILVVLTGIFLLAVLGVVVLVRALLRREGRAKR